MSKSIALYRDLGDHLHLFDPDKLPHAEDQNEYVELIIAIMNAGYAGISVDTQRLNNGRILLAIGGDPVSPEFRVIQKITDIYNNTKKIPSIDQTLDAIQQAYSAMEVIDDL